MKSFLEFQRYSEEAVTAVVIEIDASSGTCPHRNVHRSAATLGLQA
jgi:hypothetical protein